MTKRKQPILAGKRRRCGAVFHYVMWRPVNRGINYPFTFRLDDGRTLALHQGDSRFRHTDCAWVSTVRAFQSRTVDTVIAAMEANRPHLTAQKSFHVEISRTRHRAELVTDDRDALRERL